MVSATSASLIGAPKCQSCGAILPPAACTPSITAFQPASDASPWKRGMFGLFTETARSTPTPSETISPTSAAARRHRARHRRHDDAVREMEALEGEGLEQGVGGHVGSVVETGVRPATATD